MRFRFATPNDAPQLVAMLRRDGGFRIDPDLEADWPALVRQLIERCPTQCVVWEDTTTVPAAPVAYGASAFVDESLLTQWLSEGRPYPANRLLRAMRDGTAQPLGQEAIRAGNRGPGLALMVVHFVLAHRDLSHPVTRRFMPAGNAAWYFVHSGYRLNSICFEVYGPESGEFMIAGGYHLLNDYGSSTSADVVAPEFRPAMYGQQRDRVRPGAMNASSLTLFNVLPPQIGLKPAEQRVALHALLGLTDQQIAAQLGLSAETVRKAWVRIFAAAEHALPAHFGSESTAGSRGPEKRRQLLEYLRVHMEELRPW